MSLMLLLIFQSNLLLSVAAFQNNKTKRSLFIDDNTLDSNHWFVYPYQEVQKNELIECGAHITLSNDNPSVRFCSQGFPYSYPSLIDCYFFITSNDPKSRIFLNITDMYIRSQSTMGCNDALEVRYFQVWQPGPSFCGESNVGMVFSTYGKDLMLKLRSGTSGQGGGFCASVTAQENLQ